MLRFCILNSGQVFEAPSKAGAKVDLIRVILNKKYGRVYVAIWKAVVNLLWSENRV
jgi:hypothetical protein